MERDTDMCGACETGYRQVWCVWNGIQTGVVCVERDTDRSGAVGMKRECCTLAYLGAFFCVCCMATLPFETTAVSARRVYTTEPCTMPRPFMQSHLHACVFNCNLPPALLAKWSGSVTCYCSNMCVCVCVGGGGGYRNTGTTGVERILK